MVVVVGMYVSKQVGRVFWFDLFLVLAVHIEKELASKVISILRL